MHELLETAIKRHQAGDLTAAARIYEQVLATEPDQPEALHLLGVVQHQQGNHAKAVELIGRALALRPNAAPFHANLAEAYRALGDFERSAGCARSALRLSPNFPEAANNLGLALAAVGKHAEAIEEFERAIALKDEYAAAHSNLGISLNLVGRTDEALAHLYRAVTIDPGYAPAQSNLGQVLVDAGRAAEAVPCCQEAVRLQPNNAAMHHNLANALRQSGRAVEARAEYLEALRLAPQLAASHAQLGQALRAEGQLVQSLTWLRQAAELEPEHAEHWANLAEVHDELEEYEASTPCWQRVLELDPKRATALVALGWAWQEQGHLDRAESFFRQALAIAPALGRAHVSLGGLHEERGDLESAEQSFREALAKSPDFAIPHARLATLLRGRLPDDDLRALEARLADAGLAPYFRARVLFGLAQVLDARGEFARAAECLDEANSLTLKANRVARPYSPEEHEQFVDAMIAATPADFFARLEGLGNPSEAPVFVVGLPRSGTTLVEQVLARHSQVFAAGELRLVRQTLESVPLVVNVDAAPCEALERLDASSLARLAESHLEELRARSPAGAARIVDKLPDNYLHLGFLAVLFPRSAMIHVRRDLRDVALSCWMTDFRSIRWASDVDHIAHRFRQYRRLMEHWRRVMPGRVFEIEYEALVTDFESQARRLVEACGLEWEAACTTPHLAQRPIRTASVTQVREPVYRRSLGRWQKYEPVLADWFTRLAT